MKFYRYENLYSNIGVRVDLLEFYLIKETAKGYWIKHQWDVKEEYKRWVSKNGKKRFAYPTKEEALYNFKKRKERQIKILQSLLNNTKMALEQVGGKS